MKQLLQNDADRKEVTVGHQVRFLKGPEGDSSLKKPIATPARIPKRKTTGQGRL